MYVPYVDKFWRGENLAILAILVRNRQIKSTPKIFFFAIAKLNPRQI